MLIKIKSYLLILAITNCSKKEAIQCFCKVLKLGPYGKEFHHCHKVSMLLGMLSRYKTAKDILK